MVVRFNLPPAEQWRGIVPQEGNSIYSAQQWEVAAVAAAVATAASLSGSEVTSVHFPNLGEALQYLSAGLHSLQLLPSEHALLDSLP